MFEDRLTNSLLRCNFLDCHKNENIYSKEIKKNFDKYLLTWQYHIQVEHQTPHDNNYVLPIENVLDQQSNINYGFLLY